MNRTELNTVESLLLPVQIVHIILVCMEVPKGHKDFFVFFYFLADHTNGRAIGTVLHLSVSLSSVVVFDVMYCG